MKRFLSFLAFVLFAATIALAQNGNGNGGNSSYPTNGFNAANFPWPNSLVVHILQQAHPYFHGLFNVNQGQLLQAYRRGDCVIQFLGTGTVPSSLVFQVTFGGGISIVIIEDAG
jgi:hypothetical protein